MIKKEPPLTKQMKIALEIYKYGNRPVKLVQLLGKVRPSMTLSTLDNNINSLANSGIIEIVWQKEDNRWVRGFVISRDSVETLKLLTELVKGW